MKRAYDPAKRRAAGLKRFGLTAQQYEAMLLGQGGKCAICRRPPKTRRLSVEHDHQTKRVRGLTCHACNRHLIGKNTLATAKLLVAYLGSDFDGRRI